MLVSLSNELQDAINGTQIDRRILDHRLDELLEGPTGGWRSLSEEVVEFLRLVLLNNPGRSIDELLQPDVLQAVESLRSQLDSYKGATYLAWDRGTELGRESGVSQLAKLGLVYAVTDTESPEDQILRRIIGTIEANELGLEDTVAGDMEEASRSSVLPDKGLRAVERNSGYAVETALKKAYLQAQESVFEQASKELKAHIRKMWVARFGPGTCATCAALHGTIRELGEVFPDDAHLGSGKPPKPFGFLGGPPRHPNCRCRLVPLLDGMERGPGPTPATMKMFAARWWRENHG